MPWEQYSRYSNTQMRGAAGHELCHSLWSGAAAAASDALPGQALREVGCHCNRGHCHLKLASSCPTSQSSPRDHSQLTATLVGHVPYAQEQKLPWLTDAAELCSLGCSSHSTVLLSKLGDSSAERIHTKKKYQASRQ